MAFTASSWGQGRLLTGLSPGSSLSGFTAVITKDNLEVAALDAGVLSCLNGGGDWRFSTDIDGVNQLPCEIVTCVTSATPANTEFVAWVRFPTYASGTREVYAFWNRAGQSQPAVGAAFGRDAVWVDYEAVLHMHETGTDGVFVDSAGNGHDTTKTVGATLNTTTSGNPFGLSWPDFTASQILEMTNSAQVLNNSAFNISVWLSADSRSSSKGLVGNRYQTSDIEFAVFNVDERIVIKGASSVDVVSNANALPLASTQKMSASHDSTSLDLYRAGVSKGTVSPVANTGGINSPIGNNYQIGSYFNLDTSRRFNGRACEIRLRRSVLSSNFESAEYDNQNNPAAFWTEGAVFVPGAGAISVTESLTTLTLDSLNPTIGLTGVVSITESLTNINFAALDPVITLTATITVTESLTNLNFNAFDPTVTLTPPDTILVTETTTALTLDTFNPNITFSGTITVTESLTNLDFRAYRPTVQVGAKEYTNIFYGVAAQQVTFAGTSVSSTFSGTIKQAPDFSGIITTSTFSGVSK